jgi:hypothetical protein
MFGRIIQRVAARAPLRHFSSQAEAEIALTILEDLSKFYSLIPEMRTENIYLAATQNPLFNLSDVCDEWVTEELCLYAVRFSGRQIDKVPPRFKPAIDQYLAGVENIVIREFDEIERRQFVACYLTNPETAYNSIVIDSYAVPMLLDRLGKVNSKKLNLVFLGHSGPSTESLARHAPGEMVELLKGFPSIHKITLLGCRTVQASRLNAEIDMVKNYKISGIDQRSKNGLVLVRKIPNAEVSIGLLRSMRVDKAFVVVGESSEVNGISVFYIENTLNNELRFSRVDITLGSFAYVQQQLKSGKAFTFPKSENEKFILRDYQHPLTGNELELLERARDGMDEFTVHHPNFEFNESIYPFLTSVTTDMREYHKLEPSLMPKGVSAINQSDEIKREITVEAYPKAIFPDMKNKCMLASRLDIYSRAPHTFFTNRIDYRLLGQDRRKSIKAMDEQKLQGETDLRSIEMRVVYSKQ